MSCRPFFVLLLPSLSSLSFALSLSLSLSLSLFLSLSFSLILSVFLTLILSFVRPIYLSLSLLSSLSLSLLSLSSLSLSLSLTLCPMLFLQYKMYRTDRELSIFTCFPVTECFPWGSPYNTSKCVPYSLSRAHAPVINNQETPHLTSVSFFSTRVSIISVLLSRIAFDKPP